MLLKPLRVNARNAAFLNDLECREAMNSNETFSPQISSVKSQLFLLLSFREREKVELIKNFSEDKPKLTIFYEIVGQRQLKKNEKEGRES